LFAYLFIINRTQGTVKIKASVNYNMLKIEVQRYRNRRIKTEKLRNTQ